jgi:zinc/manganese transport system permease protein
MRHAFEAGTIIALVAGVVGYFVVLRRLSFAAHALSHIGFAGAAGAVLISINPLIGLLAFTISGGLGMATLGKRAINRDVQIGTVLAFMLGLGVLFISLYKGYATEAYSILFGEILGISASDVVISLITGILILFAMYLIYRPLLFTTMDEDVAEAKGLPVLGINTLFLVILAVATSIAVQVVGVLLIFALLVTPAAIAERLSKKPVQGIIISSVVALIVTWFGIFISYYQPYPVSFFITTAVFFIYIIVRLTKRVSA